MRVEIQNAKQQGMVGKGCSKLRGYLLAGLLLVAFACTPLLRAQESRPKVVELTYGVCPVVAQGDILTFDFQPQFDSSAAEGIKNLSLVFVAESIAGRHQAPDFTLHAVGRENTESASSIQSLGGGHFRFRFRINGNSVEPGNYRLNRIEADAIVPEGYRGDVPKLINSPNRSSYCLVVGRGR